MARRIQTNKINYLKINSNGVLYTRGNEGADGVVEVELKDGRKYYHELFNGGSELGYITYMGVVDKEFKDGKVTYFQIIIQGDEEADCIQIPFKTNKGFLNPYVKNIASLLPSIDYTRKISLKPSTKKNDRGFVYPSVYLNYEDRTLVEFAHTFGEGGDIPSAEKVEKLGVTTYDFTAQDEFLFNILEEQIKRFQEYRKTVFETEESEQLTGQVSLPTAKETSNLPQGSNSPEGEITDDLPF